LLIGYTIQHALRGLKFGEHQMNTLHTTSVFVFLIFLNSCASYVWNDGKDDVILMTYNVENLFDTTHDLGKNDLTYLPLSKKGSDKHQAECDNMQRDSWRNSCLNDDWNPEVLTRKMNRLTDVLAQMKDGRGPDILFFQEVENLKVLEQWRKNHLQSMNYKKALLIEGPDKRGIDTALMSRFPLKGKPKLHTINFLSNDKLGNEQLSPSRGILEATFILPGGDLLTCLSLHLPSQGSPTEKRRQVLQKLTKIRNSLPSDRMVIAAGDFNITKMENIREDLLPGYLDPQWLISHQVGCTQCKGTHNYRGEWSFLDMILFSKNLKEKGGDASWKMIELSIRTPNNSKYQLRSNSFTPSRFGQGKSVEGVSDHLPLAVNLRRRK
jgi:endonuclease/exonuclease/phosphatase family metal-dependent hydrolase